MSTYHNIDFFFWFCERLQFEIQNWACLLNSLCSGTLYVEINFSIRGNWIDFCHFIDFPTVTVISISSAVRLDEVDISSCWKSHATQYTLCGKRLRSSKWYRLGGMHSTRQVRGKVSLSVCYSYTQVYIIAKHFLIFASTNTNQLRISRYFCL